MNHYQREIGLVRSARLSRLNLIEQTHKGFQIGYFVDYPGGRHQITAAYKWPDGGWHETNCLLDKVGEVFPFARAAIDYALVVDAMEKQLCRPVEMNELPKIKDTVYE